MLKFSAFAKRLQSANILTSSHLFITDLVKSSPHGQSGIKNRNNLGFFVAMVRHYEPSNLD